MLDQRIEWLATLCHLEPVSIRVIRVLVERDRFVTLGELVDRLDLPPLDAAQLASRRSPLRDWGLVRVAVEPEPALKLNERIRRFLLDQQQPGEANALALCRIKVVRRPASELEAARVSAQERPPLGRP